MPTVVHFDIAADNPQRAKKFYEEVFNWKIEAPPGMPDYYLVETKDIAGGEGVGGGLGKRQDESQRITTFFGVDSIEEYTAKIKKSGGTVLQAKMPVPGWGYLATCLDTESNLFGIWQLKKFMGKEYMGVVRSTFIIDPEGKVAANWTKVKVKGHVDAVKEKLQELQNA